MYHLFSGWSLGYWLICTCIFSNTFEYWGPSVCALYACSYVRHCLSYVCIGRAVLGIGGTVRHTWSTCHQHKSSSGTDYQWCGQIDQSLCPIPFRFHTTVMNCTGVQYLFGNRVPPPASTDKMMRYKKTVTMCAPGWLMFHVHWMRSWCDFVWKGSTQSNTSTSEIGNVLDCQKWYG